MAIGKYLSLEEARLSGKIKQFCKEHPSKGDRQSAQDVVAVGDNRIGNVQSTRND